MGNGEILHEKTSPEREIGERRGEPKNDAELYSVSLPSGKTPQDIAESHRRPTTADGLVEKPALALVSGGIAEPIERFWTGAWRRGILNLAEQESGMTQHALATGQKRFSGARAVAASNPITPIDGQMRLMMIQRLPARARQNLTDLPAFSETPMAPLLTPRYSAAAPTGQGPCVEVGAAIVRLVAAACQQQVKNLPACRPNLARHG
jgi:hypothetical protein